MKILIFASIGVILFLINGCVYNPYNYTYIQTPVNVPNLEEKGDLHVDGYLWHNHADLQASYAPLKNIGVIASYNQGFKNSIQYGELGAGYFSGKDHRLRVHLFAGAGIGDLSVGYTSPGPSHHVESEYVFDLNSHYYKLFIQPSIGINISKKLSLTTTVRISYVNFQSYSYLVDYYSYDSVGNTRVIYDAWTYHVEPSSPEHVYIFDPSSTFTANFSNRFAFIATLNYSIALSGADGSSIKSPDISATSHPSGSENSLSNKDYTHPVYSRLGMHIGVRWKISTRKS